MTTTIKDDFMQRIAKEEAWKKQPTNKKLNSIRSLSVSQQKANIYSKQKRL